MTTKDEIREAVEAHDRARAKERYLGTLAKLTSERNLAMVVDFIAGADPRDEGLLTSAIVRAMWRCGVSRSAVRNALNYATAAGLLDREPSRGGRGRRAYRYALGGARPGFGARAAA